MLDAPFHTYAFEERLALQSLRKKPLNISPFPSIGVLVSRTDTFLSPSTNPSSNRDPLEESEEEDEDPEEQPVQVLTEVGTFETVVIWNHEKVPGEDDLFLRGLGEEGSRWRAGMHAF